MSYFTFKNGQATGTEFIVMRRQFVSSGLFTPMSSDSEPNSFSNLSRISDEDIMEEDQEDVEKSLTHKLTSRLMSRDVLTARFKCHF